MVRIARVFPRKTNATPVDEHAFYGPPPEGCEWGEYDQIHISIAFTYDIEKANEMADRWSKVSYVSMGGPALNSRGGDFIPGMYLKPGYVITSRGCPNDCWFCSVPKREGGIRELPIVEGYNILDSNLLACSDQHIQKVFEMLGRQSEKAEFTGGLEAKILKDRHVSMLWDLKPRSVFFAYDTLDDLEPLIEAGKKMRYADFTRYHLRCYVLIGWPKDTFEEAQKRLLQAWKAGFLPVAMLWKDHQGNTDKQWARFQRSWCRAPATKAQVKEIYNKEKK